MWAKLKGMISNYSKFIVYFSAEYAKYVWDALMFVAVEYFVNALFGWLWSGRDYCWITLLLDFELWTKAQCEVEFPGDAKKREVL